MSGYTKGPWVVGSRHTEGGVYTNDGVLVANTHGSYRNYDREVQIAEQDANARLVAAAPDMLAALKLVRAWQRGETTAYDSEESLVDALMAALDAALTKAEGQS